MINEDAVKTLNHLIKACNDSYNAFREAAAHAGREELVQFFHNESVSRAHMQEDLQTEVLRLGGDPEVEGTDTGVLRSVWISLKGTLNINEASFLKNIAASEEMVLEHFDTALNNELPAEIRELVLRMRNSIEETLERLTLLQGRTKTKHA